MVFKDFARPFATLNFLFNFTPTRRQQHTLHRMLASMYEAPLKRENGCNEEWPIFPPPDPEPQQHGVDLFSGKNLTQFFDEHEWHYPDALFRPADDGGRSAIVHPSYVQEDEEVLKSQNGNSEERQHVYRLMEAGRVKQTFSPREKRPEVVKFFVPILWRAMNILALTNTMCGAGHPPLTLMIAMPMTGY
ncbi:hypothetical protein ZHAS_00020569 [Anopheles sinensis]|uniref:Uncharacterized protein n=1 Tax=Anopheles sinensis TaxID=74873 RepID=A0A084WQ59_ANOSI|nr:hypothetical protein ZHAS_00020569 [Anopheles sinensis]